MTPSLAPEIVRPQTHKLAIWLMIAAALIQAINSLVAIASAGTIVDSAMARNRGTSTLDSHQLSQATAVAKGFVVGLFVTILIISLIVWALMIWFNLKGRNWARITATVLGGLGIIGTLTSMGQTASNGLTVVLGVILLLVEIAILVLLWMKPTSAFYKAVSAQRAALKSGGYPMAGDGNFGQQAPNQTYGAAQQGSPNGFPVYGQPQGNQPPEGHQPPQGNQPPEGNQPPYGN